MTNEIGTKQLSKTLESVNVMRFTMTVNETGTHE